MVCHAAYSALAGPDYLATMETVIGRDLGKMRDLLHRGEVCAIPTETVYGLAGNALLPDTILRIFEIKNRPAFDPLIVHIASSQMLRTVAKNIPSVAFDLAEAFWPGPLTLVLTNADIIPDIVSSGLDTVGVRVPAHPLTLSLLNELTFPLAAPSANPFGYISPTSAQHVYDQLQGKIPYILDGGPCEVGIESTIVDCSSGTCTVLRLGGLSIESIEQVAGPVQVMTHSSSSPAAPGMLTHHYAPRKALYLGNINDMLARSRDRKVGILSFQQTYSGAANEVLSGNGNLMEAARNLFACLRKLDQSDVEVIFAEPVPEQGIGRSINDRLRRASANPSPMP
jgi:L-threonylcarbamoyladenylate synthase